MASEAPKTGLALTISLGLIPPLPTDAFARGEGGRILPGQTTRAPPPTTDALKSG
jgi:hypothetical protein